MSLHSDQLAIAATLLFTNLVFCQCIFDLVIVPSRYSC